MRVQLTIVVLGLLMCLLVDGGSAQEPKASRNDVMSNSIYSTGWKTVELRELSVSLPEYMAQKDVKCFEGGCYRFEGQGLVFKIDLNVDAWRPTFEKRYQTYQESFSTIGGKKVWLWSFEDNGRNKFNFGVNFNLLKRRNYDVGFYVFAPNDASAIASKIFDSIRFIEPVKVY